MPNNRKLVSRCELGKSAFASCHDTLADATPLPADDPYTQEEGTTVPDRSWFLPHSTPVADVSRRSLFAGVASTVATLGLGSVPASAKRISRGFPKGFVWGCATAAYQIEGAAREDGRGPSIWDDFSHTTGKTANGATGDVACDSYHRYREDTQLLKDLGVGAYRFSTSWSRIFPDGRGQINQKGVDHYDRLVDNLLQNGIEPYVTLFHWDLPSALPGGWQSRDTAYAFAEYASLMAARLSDRVNNFMTMNEFASFVDQGYGSSNHAPGLDLRGKPLMQVRHHALLAHGLGVQAIRSHARAGTKVGLADNPAAVVPAVETPENIAAAKLAMQTVNAAYLPAIFTGRYPEAYLARLGADAPRVEPGDMEAISSRLDFLGLNVYQPLYVRADASPRGFAAVFPSRSFPRMTLPWLTVGPEALYWAVRLVSEEWKPRSIYITENGCPADDILTGGRVNDIERIMFLRNYITHLQRATAEKYPVKGYFAWSLLDNFEWAEGYSKRFGLYHVDFATQKRTPKLSATWYRNLIKENELV